MVNRASFDHLAIAARTLDEGAAWLADRLGISPDPGGRHLQLGTHNRLLSLGQGEYLELIATDPDGQKPDFPRAGSGWMNLTDHRGWSAGLPAAQPPSPNRGPAQDSSNAMTYAGSFHCPMTVARWMAASPRH